MSKVYWIHKSEHTDPFYEGYVGVSKNVDERIETHYNLARKKKHLNKHLAHALLKYDVEIDILFEGDDIFCYEKEREYRPSTRIGWNIAAGGDGGEVTTGMKMSKEFRKKRSKQMMGNDRAKGNKGKPKSIEHREKIAAALKGKKRSKAHSLAISKAKKGVPQKKEHVVKAQAAKAEKRKERLNNVAL